MRETAATWSKRVREWRASGETSEKFSATRGFSAGGLRHWAYRLRQTRRRTPPTESMQLVRVERVATSAATLAVAADEGTARLHLEVGEIRVAVGTGFDRATLAAILDVLAPRVGSAR